VVSKGDYVSDHIKDETRGPQFAIIQAEILDSEELNGLTARALRVLLQLKRYASTSGSAFPGKRRIAQNAKLYSNKKPSTSAVRRALRELEEAALLRTEARQAASGRQTTNLYTLTIPPSLKSRRFRAAEAAKKQGGKGAPPDGGKGAPAEGGKGAPPRSDQNNKPQIPEQEGSEGAPGGRGDPHPSLIKGGLKAWGSNG